MARRPTQKQVSFARNIIAGQAPSEALRNSLYDLSGYNSDNAIAVFAQQLLNDPTISEAIRKAQDESIRGGRLTRDDIVAILEEIAEAKISDYLHFESDIVTDSRGRIRHCLILESKNAGELTPEQLACIQEISETTNGKIRIKLKSATDAARQLAKLHGWDAPPKVPVGQDGKDQPPAVIAITREVVRE